MVSVYFIGYFHNEVKINEGVIRIFKNLEPETIFIEISKYSIYFRIKNKSKIKFILKKGKRFKDIKNNKKQDKLTDFNKISELKKFLKIPREFILAKEIAKALNIPLKLIDSSRFAKILIKNSIKTILNDNNIKLNEKKNDKVNLDKTLNLLNKENVLTPFTLKLKFDKNWNKREKLMCHRIEKSIMKNKYEKIVVFCGWEHLLKDDFRLSLFSQLSKKFNCRRYFIFNDKVIQLSS